MRKWGTEVRLKVTFKCDYKGCDRATTQIRHLHLKEDTGEMLTELSVANSEVVSLGWHVQLTPLGPGQPINIVTKCFCPKHVPKGE